MLNMQVVAILLSTAIAAPAAPTADLFAAPPTSESESATAVEPTVTPADPPGAITPEQPEPPAPIPGSENAARSARQLAVGAYVAGSMTGVLAVGFLVSGKARLALTRDGLRVRF